MSTVGPPAGSGSERSQSPASAVMPSARRRSDRRRPSHSRRMRTPIDGEPLRFHVTTCLGGTHEDVAANGSRRVSQDIAALGTTGASISGTSEHRACRIGYTRRNRTAARRTALGCRMPSPVQGGDRQHGVHRGLGGASVDTPLCPWFDSPLGSPLNRRQLDGSLESRPSQSIQARGEAWSSGGKVWAMVNGR
jgi:hypothetical protein